MPRAVLGRLLDDGREVHREAERNARGGVARYRYFRKTHLSGPIVNLERTFHEPTEQEGGE